ncbi:MAG: hypothetical protein NTX82_06025 [Candidatus Parcubacteria bacterium]|nr:hypothetical protein [Candidatus Parcubacteria bacterium]
MHQIFIACFILFLLLLAVFYLGQYFIAYYLGIFIVLFTIIFLLFIFQEFFRVVFFGNAPYVTSSKKLIRKIIDSVDFKDDSVVYELGCGDARFLRELVKRHKVQAFGYEYFLVPYLLARIYNFLTRNKVKIYFQDIAKADLSAVDYVYCYLIVKQMDVLEKKFQRELKPGALVISNTFSFKNWQPEKVIVLNENKKYKLSNKLYLYRKV